MQKFLLLTAFTFFTAILASAQDSARLHWQGAVVTSPGAGQTIQVKAPVPAAVFVYAFADGEDGLEGLRFYLNDSLKPQSSLVIGGLQKNIQDPIFDGHTKKIITDSISVTYRLGTNENVGGPFRIRLEYELGGKGEFIPEEVKLYLTPEGKSNAAALATRVLIPTIDIKNPKTICGATTGISQSADESSRGLGSLFLLGFLAGLVALLTPCVFPMIPLTVSFFTKKAQSKGMGIRNAMLYGFFILLIYVGLSVPFHFLDSLNPEILNNISTNVYLNLLFFIVFVIFAFSFFGFYDISLPASMSGKTDSKAGLGNIAGIFFMALTLAIVSFSCTGPILGSLLAGSLTASGGAMQLTAGMAGFGFALALPFALFALFPNWLASLPKSGGWLNTVKVVLGFAELALALKFLSNADLVKHWGLLKRELFIGIWVLISAGLTLYLFGLIRFPHDSPIKKLHPARIGLGLLTGLFTLYLLPGLTNNPKWSNLTLISGFPPPMYYSLYQTDSECVLGLRCTKDYEEGLALARAEKKPMLIDFTGYACVNCRRMEEKVWTQPEVYQLMKDSFIVVSLYVDDKAVLPPSKQFLYKGKDGSEKEIRTVGDLWATFETENFANNAQPLYAIINTKEELLTEPVGYTPSANEYLSWLQCGLKEFNKEAP